MSGLTAIGELLGGIADIWLNIADIKHYRKISKKEKQDGIKRPFQKYFLQPSIKTLVLLMLLTGIFLFLFGRYQSKILYPKQTQEEMSQMQKRLKSWKENTGKYPENLDELIGNNPLRQNWKTDAWNNPYQYRLIQNGEAYLIVSAGQDKLFKTDDDIRIHNTK